jgi:aspartyl/asparaginyl-tRNA synthetase
MAAQHQMVATGGPEVKVQKVSKADGADGRTVEELWSQREKLKGKPVAVRGQVVKFTPVMGKNFLHLRDGSGSAEKKNNDVTVTTADAAAVGDVVTVKGKVILDKDFGAGYAYPVLIDDAKVSK